MGQDGVATVLVVDDDPVVRRVLVLQLKQLGYHALETGRGREALQLLAIHTIDAVLLDVVMPDINGIDVLLRIKGDERTENIPVLVMTGAADQEIRLTALASGAEELLSKPVDRLELGSRLRNVLKVKAMTDRMRQSHLLTPVPQSQNHRHAPSDSTADAFDGACWRAVLRASAKPLAAGAPCCLLRLATDGRLEHQQGPMLLSDLATDMLGRERLAAAVRDASAGTGGEVAATVDGLGPCTVRVEPVWAGGEFHGGIGFSSPVAALVALLVPIKG